MARALRIEYPGAVYHITSRGNAEQSVFLGDSESGYTNHDSGERWWGMYAGTR